MVSVHQARFIGETSCAASGTIFQNAGLDLHCAVRLPESGVLVDIDISTFANVLERATTLGVDLPTTLLIMPSNFERARTRSDLAHNGAMVWLSEAFNQAHIPHTLILPDTSSRARAASRAEAVRDRLDGTASLPLVCVTPRFVSHDHDRFAFVVEQIFAAACMIKDGDRDHVHVEVVVGPQEGRYVKVAYQGPPTPLPVATTIRNLIERPRK